MKLLIISLVSFLLLACGNSSPEMDMYASGAIAMREMSASIDADLSPTQQNANSHIARQVIKTGSIRFQSENVAKDYQQVKVLLSKFDSYIDSENETNSDYQIDFDISIRVASPSYDSLFTLLTQISKRVDSKASHIEDVTNQYYDLKTRIKNKKLLEAKYVELLNKAKSVKDILEIERSLNEIRNEIETAEGGFKYLSQQVSYSTIHLNLYEILPSGFTEEGFWSRVIHATSHGWKEFINFLVITVQAWPFIILLGLAIIGFKRVRRKKLQKK
ncbi:MAG: DUF4349 domain-containing protein [Cyclobacteriaceae bacterium]|nr:DUF4349 domain-containing protein [Cyclobacteriaceae bacterium]